VYLPHLNVPRSLIARHADGKLFALHYVIACRVCLHFRGLRRLRSRGQYLPGNMGNGGLSLLLDGLALLIKRAPQTFY